MIEKVRKNFYRLCKGKNFSWVPHVESTVKYALQLAKQFGADEEVVEISAWLHDIRKMRGSGEKHHVYGAKDAAKLLREIGYNPDVIEKVRRCILTHSTDKKYPPKSLEEKILASADALSHFDSFPSMVESAYRHAEPDGVNEWLLEKYAQTYEKMMPYARRMARPKYNAIKLLLRKR